MRTLRGRLTLSYALLLGTLLVIVTCALTYIAFELHVRPQVEAVRAASAEARAIAAASPGESIVVLGRASLPRRRGRASSCGFRATRPRCASAGRRE